MSFPIYRHDMPWYGALERTGRRVDTYRDEKRTSIWKRELSLGRRGTRHAVEPLDVTVAMSESSDTESVDTVDAVEKAERPSVWKRELSFGRRQTDTVGSDDPVSTDEPEQSWWSSRSDDAQLDTEGETEFVAAPYDNQDDPGDRNEDDPSEEELPPAAEKQSVWKRDLSFGRRKATDESAPVEAEPESVSDPWTAEAAAPVDEPQTEWADADVADEPVPAAEKQSIWKRDLSFGRRKGAGEGDVEVEPVEALAAEEPASYEPSFTRSVPDEPAAAESAPTAGLPLDVDAQVEPDRPSIWKRDLSFGRRKAASDWEFDVADADEAETQAAELVERVSQAPSSDAPSLETASSEAASIEPPSFEPPSFEAASFEAPSFEATSFETPSFEIAPDDTYASVEPVDQPLHSSLDEPFASPVDAGADEVSDDASVDAEPTGPARKERKRLSIGGRRGPRAPKEPKEAKAPKGSKSPSGGKKIVGLKIGASQITAAHVHSNGSLEVLKMARAPLDRGVVVAGELRDPDALGVALKAFFNDNKLPKRNVRLGIASNRVGVRVLDVSGVDDPALLGNAVRFRAQEVLPIPLSEAVLDYRVLRERRDEEGNLTREVLVAFAYRELVDRYASVCRSAGLRLVGIDLDGFALLRALVDPSAAGGNLGGAAVVTVALGHDRSIMSVSDGEVCEFTRVIEWGGSSLDTAVARILALTPSQAEPIKRDLTLDRNAPLPEGLSPEQAVRARSAMVQEVHAFAREFVSSLQFYQAQPRSLDIGEIVITGGMAHMAGLAQQLQELIGVAVRVGDPLGRVKLAKNVTSDESIGSFALAIGLGIED